MQLVTLILSFLICGILGEGLIEEKGRLLCAKQVHNSYLVMEKDIIVTYSIYNVGNSAAINVQLADNSFNSEDFEVTGHLQLKLEKLPAGSNFSHTVIVRPKKSGRYNFTSAEITYQPSESSAEILTSFSSEPGEGMIISSKDYQKKFSSHLFDWIVFALFLIPTLVVPFSMWHNIKIKYELSSKGRSKRE